MKLLLAKPSQTRNMECENIMSYRNIGKCVIKEMKRLESDILGMSEMRLTGVSKLSQDSTLSCTLEGINMEEE